jgi:hypothetical protein
MSFNKATFEAAFALSIVALATSERVTKAELQVQSRNVLEAVHVTGDIGYANRLIEVLTPVNKKTAIVYFKHFAGFSFDDTLGIFTKKSKKRYEAAHKESLVFLEDPLNNIWTWAARNVTVEQKAFSLDTVTNNVKLYLQKAKDQGMTDKDVMRAIIKGGITADCIIAMMDELGYDVAEETVSEGQTSDPLAS